MSAFLIVAASLAAVAVVSYVAAAAFVTYLIKKTGWM